MATWMYRVALRGNGRVFVYNEADAHDVRSVAWSVTSHASSRFLGLASTSIAMSSNLPARRSGVSDDSPPPSGKGVFEFVEAARSCAALYPQSSILFSAPWIQARWLVSRDEIDRWAAEGVIEYLGATQDVRPYLAATTCFCPSVLLSRRNTRSILEAMATGRAIITADTPGCRDTVVEGENGFIVPPRDPAGLAAAMKRFLDEPAFAERMGQRSAQIARERFDAKAVNRLLLGEMGL